MRVSLGLLVACFPAAVFAQREPIRRPAAVPFELAAALAAGGGLGPGEAEILVGALPEWMATRVHVPEGAVVLGAAFAGTSVVGVVQTLDTGAAAMPALETELARKGWRKPDLAGRQGGFQYTGTPGSASRFPQTFCAADRTLTITDGATRQGRQTWFYRMYERRGNYGPCNFPQRDRRLAALPMLYHPADARRDIAARMDCSLTDAPRRGMNGTGDRIISAVPADSLLAYYGRQLRDSGWVASTARVSEMKQLWTRIESSGDTAVVEVSVSTASDNPACKQLGLTVSARDR